MNATDNGKTYTDKEIKWFQKRDRMRLLSRRIEMKKFLKNKRRAKIAKKSKQRNRK